MLRKSALIVAGTSLGVAAAAGIIFALRAQPQRTPWPTQRPKGGVFKTLIRSVLGGALSSAKKEGLLMAAVALQRVLKHENTDPELVVPGTKRAARSSMTQSEFKKPAWWNQEHESGWERTKDALKRDWEQTKADVSKKGQELNQDAGDTVKQAMGKEAIPPDGVPNADSWGSNEPALRYGYGARQYFSESEWNDDLEGKLRTDYEQSGQSGAWDKVKGAVRRGWESVKKAV